MASPLQNPFVVGALVLGGAAYALYTYVPADWLERLSGPGVALPKAPPPAADSAQLTPETRVFVATSTKIGPNWETLVNRKVYQWDLFPEAPKKLGQQEALELPAEWKLEAIYRDENVQPAVQVAIVSGQMVQEGDKLGAFKVKKIGEDEVVFAQAGNTRALKFRATSAKVEGQARGLDGVMKSVALVRVLLPDSTQVSGSGFVVPRGVVTSRSLVEKAERISVIFQTDGKEIEAKVVKQGEGNLDLALLRATPLPAPLPLARQKPSLGDNLYVVGLPTGQDWIFSEGRVTGMGPRKTSKAEAKRMGFSAKVAKGSAGSPVLNGGFEVIGVVQGDAREGQENNFAISLEDLREFLR